MDTKSKPDAEADELREGYDLNALEGGMRGKYYTRAKEGTNLVLLDPDVARVFSTPTAVNEALRTLLRIAEANSAKGRGER